MVITICAFDENFGIGKNNKIQNLNLILGISKKTLKFLKTRLKIILLFLGKILICLCLKDRFLKE